MDTDAIRGRLTQRLEQLTERLGKIESHLRSPGPKDSQEWASEAENSEVLERLDETERREVEEIRGALGRIDAGSYGSCTACGEAIGERRLEAIPTTRTCIACAR
jgi:RNA polymerase-binding protein DksA